MPEPKQVSWSQLLGRGDNPTYKRRFKPLLKTRAPRDPGSPNLRMVSWNINTMRFGGDWTPQSSAENITGCLGHYKPIKKVGLIVINNKSSQNPPYQTQHFFPHLAHPCQTVPAAERLSTFSESIQWLFLVPLKGGRWHIIPQLAVHTTYIPLIYCLLGGYIIPTTYYQNLKNPLINSWEPY